MREVRAEDGQGGGRGVVEAGSAVEFADAAFSEDPDVVLAFRVGEGGCVG